MNVSDVCVTINCDYMGYPLKPTKYQVNDITKRIRTSKPRTMSLNEFCDVIARGKTFISGCVVDPSANTLKATNTNNYAFFGLDIDNKEFNIAPSEMIAEVEAKLGIVPTIFYDTFTSTSENRKFRLIYVFEKPIEDYQTFKKMYQQLKILFPNLIDQSTSNPNRLWFATNKVSSVRLNPNAKLLGKDFFEKLNQVVPLEKKDIGFAKKKDIKYSNCDLSKVDDIYRYVSFKKESAHELAKFVIDNVSIIDYVKMAGGQLHDFGSYCSCACPFHGGDNEHGFIIYKHSNSAFCFTKNCCAGDVINLCKVFENKNYFDAIRTLLNRFNLMVPFEYIERINVPKNN